VTTLYVNRPLWVSQLYRPIQLSIPPGATEWVVIYVITGLETIKRQTKTACGCMPKSVSAGLGCGLGCTSGLSVSHSATAAAVSSIVTALHVYRCLCHFHLYFSDMVSFFSRQSSYEVWIRSIFTFIYHSMAYKYNTYFDEEVWEGLWLLTHTATDHVTKFL